MIESHMRDALALAERGRGFVEPNPLVGAVVLSPTGEVVGRGWHAQFGGPHAEVVALDEAGPRAAGGTLVVTLEPCCHFGKTPPCVERILAAGVRRVVAAMIDPYPAVAGGGAAQLQAAGVAFESGTCEAEARKLNAPYLCLLANGRPYFHAKWAMSLDGRIATASGQSKWITGAESRAHAHAFRGQMCGIVVGVGTVLADDPLLTARPAGPRVATRIVLDTHLRTPPDCQLVRTAKSTPTLIVTGTDSSHARRRTLEAAGCELLPVACNDLGRVSLPDLAAELGARMLTNVLVEGGSETLGGFFDAGLIDAVRVYIAAKILGGSGAIGPIGGIGRATPPTESDFTDLSSEPLGPDRLVCGRRRQGK